MVGRALTGLRDGRVAVEERSFPNAPGLYALYGSREVWGALKLELPDFDVRPLYVGKAERSLKRRDFTTHFATGKTGWSTLRRALAALLNMRAALRNSAKPARPTHYGLHEDDEKTLTEWMMQRLEIAVWEKPADCENLGDLEKAVLQSLKPPLNVKDNESPWRAQVSAARKAMVATLQAG